MSSNMNIGPLGQPGFNVMLRHSQQFYLNIMLKCKGSKNKIEARPIVVYILNNKKPISYRNQNGIQSAKNLEFKTQQNFQVVSRNEKKKEKKK